ncbi:DUF1329 domain-containing protein [Paraburkholderia sp. CNPSo 3272]|uniref:DUF1329 domain-containing protein n=1 Tax=Paraburkholderia sp. CNPSo 3272 TaxID=2940931 RepID=UPI0020B86590|nr:DUF1329 domain-containing protein [Paraburkholderia sp. CNPSo 3272]MCP3725724.1 DUF1329 domain-containing protein [Paraburkholderia sp. CNPSo 3272]
MVKALKKHRILMKALAFAAAVCMAPMAGALENGMTPFGSQIAGSKDGAIPAYTGGITQAPAGFKPDSGRWADPFAGEKPTMQITAQNYQQYADKLSASSVELFKRYPTYRMDVYPTHRSVSYPDWYLANSEKNAQSAKLEKNGLFVEDAFGGKPFPVPRNGQEAMWDWELRYVGTAQRNNVKTWLVDASGTPILAAQFKSSTYDYKVPYSLGNWFYDFNSGVYIFGSHPAESPGVFFNSSFSHDFFTPEHMQSSGIR